MTAKPRKQAKPTQTTRPAQPGSIMDSIQSEVATEASPMLLFLTRNARIMALALVLCIAGIIGYWVHAEMAKSKREETIAELGKILILSDAQMRLERLESFAPNAQDSVKRQTWYSIMHTANELKDYARVYTAWEHIRDFDDNIRATATVGMADALSSQNKYKEALALLESVTSNLKDASAPPVYMRILALADSLGEYERALGACNALLGKTTNPSDISLWTQKKILLEEQIAAAKK